MFTSCYRYLRLLGFACMLAWGKSFFFSFTYIHGSLTCHLGVKSAIGWLVSDQGVNTLITQKLLPNIYFSFLTLVPMFLRGSSGYPGLADPIEIGPAGPALTHGQKCPIDPGTPVLRPTRSGPNRSLFFFFSCLAHCH